MARTKSSKHDNDVSSNPLTTSGTPMGPASAAPAGAEGGKSQARGARRPEVVKTEPRATLVPINLEDEIRRAAYLMAEKRGFEPGHETEDWIAAEREVRQRYHRQSA